MTPRLSKQPFKSLYIIFLVLRFPFLLAFLTARYSLKPFRPVPEWSFSVCVIHALTREFWSYSTVTRMNLMSAVESGHAKAKHRFALARPGAPRLYGGVLSTDSVKPAAVGGLWFPGPLPTSLSMDGLAHEKVVLHVPGGAFVVAFAFEGFGLDVANTMEKHLKATRTFFAQYRPAVQTQSPFPAAVQDLLTFYHHILSLGVRPKNIILSGDSAGGNIVIALLRYLEKTSVLPLPAGAMAWSPWVHVTPTAGRDFLECRNHQGDFLVGPLLQWGVDEYIPNVDDPTRREIMPYISPLHHPFETSIPLFVHAGTAEAFHYSIRSFASEMAELNPGRVRLHETPLAPHNLLLSHPTGNRSKQLYDAADDAYEFFQQFA
ncbi:alpha/beta-hydrolase [Xylariomycetidae sp. FL0641]|nr:alpha/beta-hydrolase [Xylariomycetidae sp. FL0641]